MNQALPAHDLSLLCVTKVETYPILDLISELVVTGQSLGAEVVLVADGQPSYEHLNGYFTQLADFRIHRLHSDGYIESVLDRAVDLTSRPYVFRIDDDESLSDGLVAWLIAGAYRSAPHWKFPRAHLWRDKQHYITNPPLWPDEQTRLSTRELSYGRSSIHCGSPFGGGELCPHPLLHHKFLVKSREEREAIVKRYDAVSPGMGTSFALFSVPELLETDTNTIDIREVDF